VALVQRRVGAVFALFFFLLVLAGARTLYLATLQGGSLRQAARSQQLTYEPVPARRGTISDRNGLDLAVSEPAQDISATPYLLRDPLSAAQRLAPLLGQPQDRVLRKLTQRTGFVYLARALPDARARAVLALKLPGVAGTPVMRRVYPRGALAAQVIGVVGTEGNGLEGLEYSRNALLHGRSGERRVVSDAIGQPVSITESRQESSGVSLSLTLDANIQQRTEEVLGALGASFGPRDATAIVMDPSSGAVLAMANWPQVNANYPGGSSPDAFENRAVGFDYEPGSTFKAVTVAGALQQGAITPSTGFEVPDQIQVADRTIHDDVEHGVEPLSTAQILARSSNVGAIKIGFLEGAASFHDWVQRFGFGARTGIGLPGEETGFVLPLSHYSGSSMGNLPIGQGQLVTPLQMATAYSAIANGGILRPPSIIRSVGDRLQPEPAGRRVISAATAAELRRMLEGVLAPGGTASEVSIPGYKLAGKTGTANKVEAATGQYSQTAYVVSFMGFAPASDPKLVCAVIVDEPHAGSGVSGGSVAAPAFGQIMRFALPYLRIPPG
jgi:cell division protein FtsI (penicillin-binding protein 3)